MTTKEELEQEIHQLKFELSDTIPQELREAAETGDIRENSDYASILTRQHMINLRLAQLITRVNAFKNLNLDQIPTDRVGVGSLIETVHIESGDTYTYKIVVADISEEFTDIFEATRTSPIGKALMDKQVGDTVCIRVPNLKARTLQIKALKTIHELSE